MHFLKSIIVFFLFILNITASAQTVKILFDATKAEMAGNADWVIDADSHNIGNQNGTMVQGQGNESNPQRFPTPAQSGVNSNTDETYWDGALSSWGIDCVHQNYQVETLPYDGAITYGNSNNPKDLSNYKVFIVCEPNIVFSASEKTAMINFVQNGGGLFMISDHNNSDRNNDGWDSPHIWNDFMGNNSIKNNPFGITFDYVDISGISTNISAASNDSIINGTAGSVNEVQWSDGTTMTIATTQNPTVKGVIFKSGSSIGSDNVLCVYARYGNGKVAAIGDSSPCDDGTGDPNDNLYNGYTQDASGNHQKLLMNITIWLAQKSNATDISQASYLNNSYPVFPNPFTNEIYLNNQSNTILHFALFNALGISVMSKSIRKKNTKLDTSSLPKGVYFYTIDYDNGVSRNGSLIKE